MKIVEFCMVKKGCEKKQIYKKKTVHKQAYFPTFDDEIHCSRIRSDVIVTHTRVIPTMRTPDILNHQTTHGRLYTINTHIRVILQRQRFSTMLYVKCYLALVEVIQKN